MKTLTVLGAAALISLALDVIAYGGPAPCERVVSGYADGSTYTAVRRGNELSVYRLSSGSKDWILRDFPYHASATVRCRDCAGPRAATRAVVWLTASSNAPEMPDLLAGRDLPPEPFIPWFETRFDHAKVRSAASPVDIGAFRGWLLDVVASTKGVVTHDVIDVFASDGCASMHVRIETPPSSDGKPLDAVSDLLRSIQVSAKDARSDPLWHSLSRYYAATSSPKKVTFEEFRKAIGAGN